MSDLAGIASPYQLVAAGAYLLPALVWGILARTTWRFLLKSRPRSRFFRLLPVLTTTLTLIYGFLALFTLIPADLQRHPSPVMVAVFAISNLAHVVMAAVARHLVLFLPLHEEPPSRRWLIGNYGLAAVVGVLALFPGLIPAASFEQSLARFFVVRNLYVLVMLALVLRQLARFARGGMWRPGSLLEARTADVVLIACGVIGAVGWVLFALFGDFLQPPPTSVRLYDVVVGVLLAAPLVVRLLGETVRGLLLVGTMAGATAALYFGAGAVAASLGDPRLRPLVDLVTIVLLLAVLVPGQAWVRAAIDRIVFRRSWRRREELRAFLQTLAPDLGTIATCQQALAELARVMHLPGAAILLADGSSVAHGAFALDRLARAWPRGAAADSLPSSGLADHAMREVPDHLKDALIASEVVAVLPIRSPRRPWGHLFITSGLLAAAFSDEDVQAGEAFASQLALVLDSAELLDRAVAVERSLAHSEKLAAIGELAARIAHEIRNPVTAARSLAQQLAREPASAFAAEHELILTELERVERQVAALLRFARREEFRFEPVDLGQLVRATVEAFGPHLAAAGIELAVETDDHVAARADREKMRQVLVNLIENAVDALADAPAARRLALSVSRVDGTATLSVEDSGPGVPADALSQLFEPFFSLKPSGTGLGLAIAKRTVDAHGGRITAASPPGAGLRFDITLPLAREA